MLFKNAYDMISHIKRGKDAMNYDATIACKGRCWFYLLQDDEKRHKLSVIYESIEQHVNDTCIDDDMKKAISTQMQESLTFEGDIFEGHEFSDDIKSGCITDYDGFIGCIVVNGYKSNLGIISDDFMQGDCLVSLEVFEGICKQNDVSVVWHNR